MGYIAQTSGTRPLAVDTSSPRQTATNQAFPQEQPSTATIRAQESSWSSPTEFPSSDFAPGSHFVTSPIPVVYQPFEADESAVRGLSRQQQSPTKETTWKREFREFTKKEWLEEDNASFSNGKYQPQQVRQSFQQPKTSNNKVTCVIFNCFYDYKIDHFHFILNASLG